jgi:DNA-binding transcriptional MerR regulator
MRIGSVSRRTGLPTATIRSWERRYGLLAPVRSAHGQRLYTERDVQALLQVRERLRLGWALSAAAAHALGAQHDSNESGAAAHFGETVITSDGPMPDERLGGATRRSSAGYRIADGGTRTRTDVAEHRDTRGSAATDQLTLVAAHEALRAVVRAPHPTAVVAALVELTERVGGRVGPATARGDDLIPIDIGLGETDPLLVRAEPFSVARMRLEAILPALVEDARRMIALLRAAGM